MNPFISIIIPIYNRERTLHYCIESVINQEYKTWELLLIDDGSIDNSAEICKTYTQKDYRIKYFYQANKGAGPARNIGIEKSSGEWVTFLDSDDAIMPNHLSQVVNYGDGFDLVMVNRCKAVYLNGELTSIDDNTHNMKSISLKGNRNIIDFLYGDFNPYLNANYACWDKFFSASIIKKYNIRYPINVPTGQDQIFVVRYFMYTESFYFSNIGTYAPTPMGNEGIDHLACKLRHPSDFFHCQIANYNTLNALSQISGITTVRKYAINYILSKPLERILIPYTHLRNRKKIGKHEMLSFIQNEYKPLALKLVDSISYVKEPIYREYINMIILGKESDVYDHLFIKNLKKDLRAAVIRRWRKYIK